MDQQAFLTVTPKGNCEPLRLLREATSEQHEALDRSDWFDRATADLTSYVRHIELVRRFYGEAERLLGPYEEQLEACGLAPEARRKSAAIERECCELPAVTATPDSVMSAFPPLGTFSAAIGCAYVLEGATLGGVVLGGRIRERLGWQSRFYGIYGAQTSSMWRSFVAVVDGMRSEIDLVALTSTAVAVFDAYGEHIVGFDHNDGSRRSGVGQAGRTRPVRL